jgi:hypothetical protein
MAVQIQAIFINPPIAVARLGGSNTPMDSFRWVDSPDPHLQTVISPDWSLDVDLDGVVTPRMPESLTFRDGLLIRPVAPFFELWALLGEPGSDADTWKPNPLTPSVLKETGADTFILTVDARNKKAARRTQDARLEFGTFPPLVVSSENHHPVPIIATSPPGIPRPMIPLGSPGIPLGFVQILQTRNQPQTPEWSSRISVDQFRFRIIPAKGEIYGPIGADKQLLNGFPAVKAVNAFLNPDTSWVGAPETPWLEPNDTFDGADMGQNRSIGVIDDTFSANLSVRVDVPGRDSLIARATVFVSPPDFAPDRRPFLSLADELNDRMREVPSNLDSEVIEQWVQDLFERIYETASLFNLDFYRSDRASTLSKGEQLPKPIRGDHVPDPKNAMGGFDKLRDPNISIEQPSTDIPLPLYQRAVQRHGELAEIEDLRDFVLDPPGNIRIEDLVRTPFTIQPNESGDASTMQMPPFMRNSNAFPLTLAQWQYDLLMKWVQGERGVRPAARAARLKKKLKPLSKRAAQRQREVLARVTRSRKR